ncbi:hypothetical protein CIPAW_07G183500 [Carya illinoinensis]|uniref:Uncharacterized protein n=1 Tax=Carya illinoinensis TaxID=32201 RepID=A0A8T1Q4E0_CARIL|nr:hypothetical protein CIPAW_07G183500 [Carya illinoinensis]
MFPASVPIPKCRVFSCFNWEKAFRVDHHAHCFGENRVCNEMAKAPTPEVLRRGILLAKSKLLQLKIEFSC